ncbi:MAG TPA: LemA family protein [Patescibacteria group bacterium]|nr:LemA family protein [Patescibacteria group bacterium]
MFPGAALILLVVALIVPAFFVLTWTISSYNRLNALRRTYTKAYESVDARLKQRYDLILDLVEAAKGYVQQTPGTTEAVVAARNSASAANLRASQLPGDPTAMKELSGAEIALTSTLRRLFAVLEVSPELKTDSIMRNAREELASSEQRVAAERQAYNDAVMRYNGVRRTFPNSVIALPFGFVVADVFETDRSGLAETRRTPASP